MNFIYKILIAIGILFTTTSVFAKEWDPTKTPIEIIVPYAPGGGADRTARLVSEIFTEHGWKSIVVNKPGNNAIIGANYVAEAKPDGYTLYMGGQGFLDANIAFKSRTDGINYTEHSFAPIVPLGVTGLFLITGENSPVNSYDEFRTYVRRNPNKFNIGYWNLLEASVFIVLAKLDGLPVPEIIVYKGAGPARVDLMSGNLEFAFDTLPSTAQQYQAGKIKILAALTDDGIEEMKALDPSIKIPNLSKKYPELNVKVWRGLYAPAGTDPAIIKEINQVVNQGLKLKKFSEKIAPSDRYGMGGTPAQLRERQTNILNRYRNMSKYLE